MSAATFADVGIDIPPGRSGEVDTLCPECSHTRKKSRDRCLSVNTEKGTWCCMHCGWSGGLGNPTPNGYGAPLRTAETARKAEKVWTRPDPLPATGNLPPDVLAWFAERGIPEAVVRRNRIDAASGAIRYPYFRAGELINIKHRGRGKHFWMVKDAERILYGLDDCPGPGEVVIVEGEMDKLAFEVAGVTRCVSVPDGAPPPDAKNYSGKFDFLDTTDVFERAERVLIATDADAPGQKLADELTRRIGPEKCWRVHYPAGCKDANDVLLTHGPDGVRQLLTEATPPDPKALLGKITGTVSATEPPAPGAGDDAPNPTDLGNARRLVAAHGAELRYCHPWGKWFAWDGRRWRLDESGEVVRRAKATIRDLYREAAGLDDAARQALGKHALRSEAGARLRAMVDLAESEPGIPVHPDDLDRDPWLLNVRNGTVNLRTGALRPHERGDLVTKLAAVEYDPAADCPAFLAFLDRIMAGNEGLIRFLQRAAGYSLTGDTSERVLMILHGEGRNGKSTFLEVLRSILGDYAIRTPTDTLMAKRENGIPNDVAALRGARFVSASEADEGRRLAEATIKDLTGGDTISARFMRGEFFNFAPEFKLWLGTNHKPGIRGTDQAIWDRIRLVPFTVRIPDSEQDKRLREKLLAEASGILTWALEGCLDWQRDGLGEPQEVTEATAGYRAEMDVLGAFLDDRCVCHERAQVSAKALYAAYQAWCDETGEKPLTQQATGRRLTERGFDSAQLGKSRTRTWLGIGLKTDDDPPQGDERVNGCEGVNGSERLFRHNQNDSKSHEVISEKAFTSVHPAKAFTLDGPAEPAPLWELSPADNDPEDDPWRR